MFSVRLYSEDCGFVIQIKHIYGSNAVFQNTEIQVIQET